MKGSHRGFADPPGAKMTAHRCLCTIQQWPPAAELSPQGLARWTEAWRANTYARGNVLFYQDNEPAGVFFVCSGAVKLVRCDGEGRQQIVRVIAGPELLGERALVAEQAYEATAEVVDEARICFMDARKFQALWIGEPGVARMIARRLADRLGQTQEKLAEMGLRTLRERLARLIARAHEKAGSNGASVELGGSRRELAEILGSSPEVVCRALAELERKKLISLEGRRARICDSARLRAIAGLSQNGKLKS